MKKSIVVLLLFIGLGTLFTSCNFLSQYFEDDEEIDPESVYPPDAKLADQAGDSLRIDFNELTDLDWFYMYNYSDEGELPEWISVSDPTETYDTTYLKPERDNSPYYSTNGYEEEQRQADATWRIDLGNTFDMAYEFKAPSYPVDYFGPNLTLRYDYDSHATNDEADVITVMVRKRPYEVNNEPDYEFFVSHWYPQGEYDNGSPFEGSYFHIGPLTGDAWHKITIQIRPTSTGIQCSAQLYLLEYPSTPVATASYEFHISPTESFYNPSFWAYGETGPSEDPFANCYVIGMMEASIPSGQ